MTKLVQDLERHLGTRLLRRTTRKVQVTAEGAAYYERARRVVAEVEDMDQLVKGSRVQLSGRLRVDVGSVVANRILLQALPQLFFFAVRPRIPAGISPGSEIIQVKPEGGVLCNESTAHVNALVCGLGVGQTFRFAAAPHLADGSLHQVLPDWMRPAQTFSLVYPGGRELNARIRAFPDRAGGLFEALDERNFEAAVSAP